MAATDPSVSYESQRARAARPPIESTLGSVSNSTGGNAGTDMPSNVNGATNANTSPAKSALVRRQAKATGLSNTPAGTNQSNVFSGTPKTLAGPSFRMGADVKTAAIDVYDQNNSVPINSLLAVDLKGPSGGNLSTVIGTNGGVVANTPKSDTNALLSLKGSSGIGTNFNDTILNTANGVTDFKVDAHQDLRLRLAIPDIHIGIKGLPPGCAANFTLHLAKELGFDLNVNVNLLNLNIANLECLIGIANLLNSHSGNPAAVVLNDDTALVGGTTALFIAALMVGLKGMFDTSTAKLTNQKHKDRVASKVARRVVAKSDTKSLKQMAVSTTKGSLKTTNPSLIRDYSRKYTRPNNLNKSGLASEYNDMRDGYLGIDSNWKSRNRNGIIVLDLSRFVGASIDFFFVIKNGILTTNDAANKNLLYAQNFQSSDVNTTLGNNFPATYRRGGSRKAVANPITLNADQQSKKTITTTPGFVADRVTSNVVKNPNGTTTVTVTTVKGSGVTNVVTTTYDATGHPI